MKAVVCHHGDFEVQDVAEPEPGKGQILLNVLRCGICGSDLHARHHADELAEATERVGYPHIMRSHEHVVLGHEFVGEIADYGAKTHRRWKPGKRVVAMPMRRNSGVAHLTGLSTQAPGAYAERVLVEESLAFPVTNGISDDHAALTEPMAVSLHAVNRSEIRRRDTAIVIGCGPIGLGVIAMLKAKGVRHIVASDYSPMRRNLAKALGAHVVVDPSQGSPYEGLEKRGFVVNAPQLFDMALDGMAMLRMTPLPWEPLWRAAEVAGVTNPKRPVIFECVGIPGMIESIVADAPLRSCIVVVGVCMKRDHFFPVNAINKEIDLRFTLGYMPIEFRDALHMIAEGKVNVGPMITGTVGLSGVDDAFAALGNPEQHAKILIDPGQL